MVEVEIFNNKGVALLDDIDADLAQRKWYRHSGGYATAYDGAREGKNIMIKMHRVVLGRMLGRELISKELADHKNGNPLDNRRENLRLATRTENAWNTKKYSGKSKYKGLSYDKDRKKWVVKIRHNKKRINLGGFEDELSAALAYDEVAKRLRGEFANTNF